MDGGADLGDDGLEWVYVYPTNTSATTTTTAATASTTTTTSMSAVTTTTTVSQRILPYSPVLQPATANIHEFTPQLDIASPQLKGLTARVREIVTKVKQLSDTYNDIFAKLYSPKEKIQEEWRQTLFKCREETAVHLGLIKDLLHQASLKSTYVEERAGISNFLAHESLYTQLLFLDQQFEEMFQIVESPRFHETRKWAEGFKVALSSARYSVTPEISGVKVANLCTTNLLPAMKEDTSGLTKPVQWAINQLHQDCFSRALQALQALNDLQQNKPKNSPYWLQKNSNGMPIYMASLGHPLLDEAHYKLQLYKRENDKKWVDHRSPLEKKLWEPREIATDVEMEGLPKAKLQGSFSEIKDTTLKGLAQQILGLKGVMEGSLKDLSIKPLEKIDFTNARKMFTTLAFQGALENDVKPSVGQPDHDAISLLKAALKNVGDLWMLLFALAGDNKELFTIQNQLDKNLKSDPDQSTAENLHCFYLSAQQLVEARKKDLSHASDTRMTKFIKAKLERMSQIVAAIGPSLTRLTEREKDSIKCIFKEKPWVNHAFPHELETALLKTIAKVLYLPLAHTFDEQVELNALLYTLENHSHFKSAWAQKRSEQHFASVATFLNSDKGKCIFKEGLPLVSQFFSFFYKAEEDVGGSLPYAQAWQVLWDLSEKTPWPFVETALEALKTLSESSPRIWPLSQEITDKNFNQLCTFRNFQKPVDGKEKVLLRALSCYLWGKNEQEREWAEKAYVQLMKEDITSLLTLFTQFGDLKHLAYLTILKRVEKGKAKEVTDNEKRILITHHVEDSFITGFQPRNSSLITALFLLEKCETAEEGVIQKYLKKQLGSGLDTFRTLYRQIDVTS